MVTLIVHTKLKRDNKDVKYSVQVTTAHRAYSFCRDIVEDGYWRVVESGNIEWLPPHSIVKVEVSGPNIEKGYNDTDIT